MKAQGTDRPAACLEYYSQIESPPAKALAWCREGSYIKWKSSLPENASFGELNIFTACLGDRTKPAVVIIHGYPTSSYDFHALATLLRGSACVRVLDMPGHGFSDKPRNGYRYSLFDDARLVDYYLREVADLKDFTLLTHDRGDSVGLALLQMYQGNGIRPYRINHLIITNGNVYLPLAKLSMGQKLLLNPVSGQLFSSMLTGSRMAHSMAETVYTPRLTEDEVVAVGSILDYQDGCRIQHSLIQYLNERKVNEVAWLQELSRSDVPTTLIWGELDPIAPTTVADYVWVNYLRNRKTPARYWRLPCANHYLQVDQPEVLSALVKSEIGGTDSLDTVKPACLPYTVK